MNKPTPEQMAAFMGEPPPAAPPRKRGRPPSEGAKGKPGQGKPRGRWASKRPWKKPQGDAPPMTPQGRAPTSGKHWTRLYDADVNRILNSQAPQEFPKALAVWWRLCQLAERRRSLTVEASDGYLARSIPGMSSRHTVRKATLLLRAVGLLTSESMTNPATKAREPFLRTLHPAGPLAGVVPTRAKNDAGEPDGEDPPPPAADEGRTSEGPQDEDPPSFA